MDRVDFTAAWQDIASAPRDGQWFYAFGKSGVIYHACWCPELARTQRLRRELAEYTALVVQAGDAPEREA